MLDFIRSRKEISSQESLFAKELLTLYVDFLQADKNQMSSVFFQVIGATGECMMTKHSHAQSNDLWQHAIFIFQKLIKENLAQVNYENIQIPEKEKTEKENIEKKIEKKTGKKTEKKTEQSQKKSKLWEEMFDYIELFLLTNPSHKPESSCEGEEFDSLLVDLLTEDMISISKGAHFIHERFTKLLIDGGGSSKYGRERFATSCYDGLFSILSHITKDSGKCKSIISKI